MINKEDFYNIDDLPDEKDKLRIKKAVLKAAGKKSPAVSFIADMRSFYMGVAACFIAIFFVIGVYSTIRHFTYEMKPEEVKLTSAYQSAIREFEKVVPAVVSTEGSTGMGKSYIQVRKEELKGIDQAIYELRRETLNNDLSPIKQMKLRELYITKLKILQEIVEQGEVKL